MNSREILRPVLHNKLHKNSAENGGGSENLNHKPIRLLFTWIHIKSLSIKLFLGCVIKLFQQILAEY